MATLQERLDEAKAAYHDLVIGNKARVIVDQNGERVEFAMTQRGALAQYIERLEAQISGKFTAKPLRPVFG